MPNLADAVCEIKSPFDTKYNCIAFAAGDLQRWWWPSEDDYWPDGVPRVVAFDAFVLAYKMLGYSPCDDGSLELGCEKIALFGKDRGDGNIVPTHAAIQLSDGRWASKLGRCEDVYHATLEAVDGPAYGTVVRFLHRLKGDGLAVF